MNVLLFALGLTLLILLGLAFFSARTARRIEGFLPPRGRFVEVPGARLHVRELGETDADRPAILLVHGLGGQGAHFDYGVAQQLAAHFRVIVVDRPGSGHSLRGPGAGADVSAQAAALAALIAQLKLVRPVVAGHSLGGAIALALALEHPASVGALALVAPLSHAPETAPAAFRALTIETGWLRSLFAWTLATPASIAGSKKVLAAVFSPEAAPRDFAVKGGGLLGLRPRAFLAASSDMQAIPLRLPQLEARYGELALPVAVLYGRQDAILDWRKNGQALAEKIPGARLELVEGGHMLPVTQPEHTADFVARVAGSVPVAAGH
ncbi:alpha/beta fold hydrolase [Massilia sp. Dwa41.01b]|uniref:alpha/beta fold hydrolase n=1 Tax=Massilia sp. Dwa41.01b TaxID=2709302 RepID=UPI001602BE79|nr:alpha/beta fold hydrolase [Massilia sp. Dwa41.01b]QNA89159.1 alpha/beta fold hydrolase [Massilia sp. Dwa41.01b]